MSGIGPTSFKNEVVRQSIKESIPLYKLVPAEYKEEIINQADAWSEKTVSVPPADPIDLSKPSIRLTSFEGSKGLSAQHVFILGLQAGELPRDANNIDDLEICKFIVALTRTRGPNRYVTARPVLINRSAFLPSNRFLMASISLTCVTVAVAAAFFSAIDGSK